jgi:hypothetical protein
MTDQQEQPQLLNAETRSRGEQVAEGRLNAQERKDAFVKNRSGGY